MNFLDIFNNREIATIFWLLVFIIFALQKRNIRESLSSVFRAMLSIKIIIPILILAFYLGGITYVFWLIKLWNISLLKDTLFWFFSAGIITIYKYVTARGGKLPIKELVYDNLKFIVVLEFIMNTFTFALWIEMIIFPVIAFVVMMTAFAEITKADRKVVKFLGGLQAIVGLVLMGNVLYSAIHEYQILGKPDTLRSFLLPILFSAAIIPMAYLMAVFSNYESLFIGFKLANKKSQSLVIYCKLMIFWNCGFSVRKISKLRPFDLMHLQSKKDIRKLLIKLENDKAGVNHLE